MKGFFAPPSETKSGLLALAALLGTGLECVVRSLAHGLGFFMPCLSFGHTWFSFLSLILAYASEGYSKGSHLVHRCWNFSNPPFFLTYTPGMQPVA